MTSTSGHLTNMSSSKGRTKYCYFRGPILFKLLSTFLAPDIENVMEKEAEAVPKSSSSPQTQEASITGPEGSTLGKITNLKGLCRSKLNAPQIVCCNRFISSLSGSKTELKALIEKAVREQMTLVSNQLDQRMRDMEDHHNRALECPPLNHKAKK